MADLYRLVVATLGAASGVPEDAVQNTFAFRTVDTNADLTSDHVLLQTAVKNFYNVTPTGSTFAPGVFLGQSVSRTTNACTMAVYAVDPEGVSPSGSPLNESVWTLTAAAVASTFPMPEEVACCLSLGANDLIVPEVDPEPPDGPAGDIHPRARHRGRLYFGPLNSAANETVSSIRPVPATNLRTALLKGSKAMRATLVSGGYTWSVWSRKDGIMRTITRAWVDDAWDIQRRRGHAASTRTIEDPL